MKTCRLKELREDRRMTQDQLAIKSGITRQTIINIETDPTYNPTVSTLIKLCDALGCTLEELFLTDSAQYIEQRTKQ